MIAGCIAIPTLVALVFCQFCRIGNATPTPRPPSPTGRGTAVEPATGTAHPSQAPATRPELWVEALGRLDAFSDEYRRLTATRLEIARLEAMWNHPSYRTEQP